MTSLRIDLASEEIEVDQFLPIEIGYVGEEGPFVTWTALPNFQKSRVFFDQYVSREIQLGNEKERLITSLDLLFRIGQNNINTDVVKFLFHASRCGSTAISNIGQLTDNSISIREPQVYNDLGEIVLSSDAFTPAEKYAALRGLTRAFENYFANSFANVLVKLSSINIMYLEKYVASQLVDEITCMIRNPIEIYASQEKQPSPFYEASHSYIHDLFLKLYGCRRNVRFFDYKNVFGEFQYCLEKLMERLGTNLASLEIEKLRHELKVYSKDPSAYRTFEKHSDSQYALGYAHEHHDTYLVYSKLAGS